MLADLTYYVKSNTCIGAKDTRGASAFPKKSSPAKNFFYLGRLGKHIASFLFDMTEVNKFAELANKSNHTCTLSHETATMRDCKAMSIAEIINTHMPALAKIITQA